MSFTGHLPSRASNEGIRLKDCIRMQQKLMNVRVRCVAAGDESLRKVPGSELSGERVTRLDGSFGTQKQHYQLPRIKTRNRKTEILWTFFGKHTSNAVLMVDRIRSRTVKAA